MTKHFSFVAKNVTPVSQNSRSSAIIKRLRKELINAHNAKYKSKILPRSPLISADPLCAKVFYLHRVPDYKDADNISKPLWDSLNQFAYNDDKQIRYLETLKIDISTQDILELDLTDIDTEDLSAIIDFLFNQGGNQDRILYISVSDHESSNVRFI